MSRLGTAVACALVAGCAPRIDRPATLPPEPAAYPRDGTAGAMGSSHVRDPGWRSAAEATGRLRLDSNLPSVLAGLPRMGSSIPVTSLSWPRPVTLDQVGDDSFGVAGEWIRIRDLRGELRCEGPDARARVRIVANVADVGGYVVVEAKFESVETAACEVSTLGSRRLQRAAMDVYRWVSGVSRAATPVPAA